MKHPSIKTLQAYFEGEISSEKIKSHIESCDKCSLMLSQMAKVDVIFSQEKEQSLRQDVKNEIMVSAFDLLKEKRTQLKKQNIKNEKRIERKNEFKNFVALRVPALQASALLILMAIVTENAREKTIIESEKLINNELSITYSDIEGETDAEK